MNIYIDSNLTNSEIKELWKAIFLPPFPFYHKERKQKIENIEKEKNVPIKEEK